MLLGCVISVMGQTAEELYMKGAEAYNKRDYATALTYFIKAADNNNASAQRMIGSCYRDGLGVKKDIRQAGAWYKKAMNNGDQYAAEIYNYMIEEIGDVSDPAMKPTILPNSESNNNPQTANNNVSSAYNRTATTSTAPAYSQAEYERKCNEIKREYGNNWQSVEERVREYEKNVESVVRAYISAIGWNGNSRMDLTNAYLTSQLNVAVSISKKTIDPRLVKRLDVSFGRLYNLKKNYDTDFSEVFWRDVYPAVAKNNKSLDFDIFYVETFHDIFHYNDNRPDYRYRTDYSVINRVSDEITRTSDRERQVYLYSEYIKLCRMANEAGKQLTINTSLSAPICKSFVDEIINTRSSQIIAKYDNITKGWPNYQSDIYNPTEEVRLYNRLRDLEAKNTRDLFEIIDPYIQKHLNSGNDISYLVLKNFESMKDEESANAIITMIHNHGDYIKQNVNFDTKLNDLLYSRLSSLDAKESIKIADNLINNNASYMQSHLAYDTKIQTLYLEKLAELDEGKRNEHIFDAIAQNKKYADKMKQKFRTVETAYTWIKNSSSASYQWTGLIDKYLSCFPTSVHKTELSKLRSTLMNRIREREEEDRRRAEAAAASRNAAAAANPKYGDYVQIEAHFDCGLLCSTPKFVIKGYVRQFYSQSSYNSLRIEVSSVSGKPDVKYSDTDWKTVNEYVKIGKELDILSGISGGTYQNLTILKRY